MNDRSPDRVVAVVQARTASTRLPGKVLTDLGGRPLIAVVLDRLRAATCLDEIVVTIPSEASDDDLAAVVVGLGHRVERAPEHDVLERYRAAAEATDADVVVRLTADNPFVDPGVVDLVVATLTASPTAAYAATGASFPEGADCEAFRRAALEIAAAAADSGSDREHVSRYLLGHPEQFARLVIERTPDLGSVRLTVDEPDDLDVARRLVERLGADPATPITDYAGALLADPSIGADRGAVPRNEGTWRSRIADELARIGMTRGDAIGRAHLRRASRVVPGASQTFSKRRDQFVDGVSPLFLGSGVGCVVQDLDGNRFIDYPMALGPMVLGYGHPAVDDAVVRQMAAGTTFSLPHPVEAEVAERIVDLVPCAEQVRFGKNGTDATAAAVRLARAVTGRRRVLVSGYHGWHDFHIVTTDRRRGLLDEIRPFSQAVPPGDCDALDAAIADGEDLAAVMIEIGVEEPDPGWFAHVRTRCSEVGALMIWDEIVTGFRWSPGGAQAHYGVTPDLACLGKAMANGWPLSAVVGPTALMEEFNEVFFSGTFGGETVSLAACRATIDEIVRADVCGHILRTGTRLRNGLEKLVAHHGVPVSVTGQPWRNALSFDEDPDEPNARRGLFLQEAHRGGVLFGAPIFTSAAHDDAVIDRTLDVCDRAFDVLADGLRSGDVAARLDGTAPGVVFAPVRP